MKKLFGKSFLALVLAMTMLMGMSMTVMAGTGIKAPTGRCNEWEHSHAGDCSYSTTYLMSGDQKCTWECIGHSSMMGLLSIPHTGDSCEYCGWTKGGSAPTPTKTSSSHTHSYEWATLVEPTTECDGEEAYVCSCGDVEMKQPLSAALYTLRLNEKAIKNAKAGATVVVDVKRFNSLPKWFVEKVVERDDLEITLKFTYNHDNYALNVPKTATIEDESIAWYGPLKLMSMFPQK